MVTMLFGPIINMYSAEEWGLAMKNSLQELPLAKPSLPPSSNKKTKGGEMNLKHENHAFGTISEISSQSGFQKLSCPSLGVPDPSARGPQRARAEDCRASTPADALEPASPDGAGLAQTTARPRPRPAPRPGPASPGRALGLRAAAPPRRGGDGDAFFFPDLRAQPVAAGSCSLCPPAPGSERAGDSPQPSAANRASAEVRSPAPRQHECARPGTGPTLVAAVPGTGERRPGIRVACGGRGRAASPGERRAVQRCSGSGAPALQGAQVQLVLGKLL